MSFQSCFWLVCVGLIHFSMVDIFNSNKLTFQVNKMSNFDRSGNPID